MSKQRTGPVLLGLTGGPGAGKDTVAGLLVTDHGFRTAGFSDALRDFMYVTDPGFAMAVDTFGYTEAKARVEGVRDRLIHVGNAAREWIHPGIWLDAVERKVQLSLADGVSIAVTGVRYWSEVEMIHALGGVVVGVDRPGVVFELPEYEDVFRGSDAWLINHEDVVYLSDRVNDLVELVNDPHFVCGLGV